MRKWSLNSCTERITDIRGLWEQVLEELSKLWDRKRQEDEKNDVGKSSTVYALHRTSLGWPSTLRDERDM